MKLEKYVLATEKLFNLGEYEPEIANRMKNDIKDVFDNSFNPEIICDNLQKLLVNAPFEFYFFTPEPHIIAKYKQIVFESLNTEKPDKYLKLFSNFFLKSRSYFHCDHTNGQKLIAYSEKIEKTREFDYSNEKSKKIDELVEQVWNNVSGSAENLINLADPQQMKFLKAVSAKRGISSEITLKDEGIFNLLLYDNSDFGLRLISGYSPTIEKGFTYPVKIKSEYNIAGVQKAFVVQKNVEVNGEGGHYNPLNNEIIIKDRDNICRYDIIPSITHEVQHSIDNLCGVKTNNFRLDWQVEYTAEIAEMLAKLTYGKSKEDSRRNFNWFLIDYHNYLADHFDKQDLKEKLRGISFNEVDKKEKLINEHFNSFSFHRKLPLNEIHRDAIYEIFCRVAGKKLKKEDCGVFMNYRYDSFKKPNLIKSLKELRDEFYKEKIGLGYEEIKSTCKRLIKNSNYQCGV